MLGQVFVGLPLAGLACVTCEYIVRALVSILRPFHINTVVKILPTCMRAI